jgi:hypothetical protein
MKVQTYYVLKYSEFDRLVADNYGLSEYECVADMEWNNDTYNYLCGTGVVDGYDQRKLDAALMGNKSVAYMAGDWLNQLIKDGILEAGDYLVHVSW